jgi:hypothetical protein
MVFMIYVTDESCFKAPSIGASQCQCNWKSNNFSKPYIRHEERSRSRIKYIIWALPVTDVGISGHPALKKANNERVLRNSTGA